MKRAAKALLGYLLIAGVSLLALVGCQSRCNILGSGKGCGPIIALAIITAPVTVPAVLIKEKLRDLEFQQEQRETVKLIEGGDVWVSAGYLIWSQYPNPLDLKAAAVVLAAWDRPDGTIDLLHQPAVFRAISSLAQSTDDMAERRRLFERIVAIGQERVFWNLTGQHHLLQQDASTAVSELLAMREKGEAGFSAEPGLTARCDLTAYQPMIRYGEIEDSDTYLCRNASRLVFEREAPTKITIEDLDLYPESRIRKATPSTAGNPARLP